MTWSEYLGTLLDELPALARSVTSHVRQNIRELLDDTAQLASRQHLLAMDHVLRMQATVFSETLAATLRSHVLDGEQTPMHDSTRPPVESDGPTGQALEEARTVGLIESIAYWELREMQGSCASLRRARSIRPEQNPLRPEMCVGAFAATLERAGFDEEMRIHALRANGSALANVLRDFYVQQCRRLARRELPTPALHDAPLATVVCLADRIRATDRPIEGTPRRRERRGNGR